MGKSGGLTGRHVGDEEGVVVVGEENAMASDGPVVLWRLSGGRILGRLFGFAQLAVQLVHDAGGLDGGDLDVDEVLRGEERRDIPEEVVMGN